MAYRCEYEDFYPRPLRGGRQPREGGGQHRKRISIHALCEEGDLEEVRNEQEGEYFYPRPLRGGRHGMKIRKTTEGKISIHALCEEGDN